jgi:hypothetical protein
MEMLCGLQVAEKEIAGARDEASAARPIGQCLAQNTEFLNKTSVFQCRQNKREKMHTDPQFI